MLLNIDTVSVNCPYFFFFFFSDVLEGEIFLQNLPSIVTAHALGTYYIVKFL